MQHRVAGSAGSVLLLCDCWRDPLFSHGLKRQIADENKRKQWNRKARLNCKTISDDPHDVRDDCTAKNSHAQQTGELSTFFRVAVDQYREDQRENIGESQSS